MKTWGFGVIGCGNISSFHIEAIRRLPNARLAAVASRDARKARSVAEREGCAACGDYRELLARDDVEIVCLTTPSGTHAEIGMDVLAAGKHLLVEKPMAMRSRDAERMMELAERKGVTLSVVSQRRFEEAHQIAKRAVDEGRLGKLLLVEAHVPLYRSQEYYDSADWRGTPDQDGGALMNQGIHSIDLLLWFGGRAVSVCGKVATLTHDMEAEDLGLAIVSFANGAYGTIMASTSIRPGFSPTLSIYGERGTIRMEGTKFVHWSVPGMEEPKLTDEASDGSGVSDPKAISHVYHERQLAAQIAAIENDQPPPVTGHDGKRAVELIEAIYSSSKTGTETAIE